MTNSYPGIQPNHESKNWSSFLLTGQFSVHMALLLWDKELNESLIMSTVVGLQLIYYVTDVSIEIDLKGHSRSSRWKISISYVTTHKSNVDFKTFLKSAHKYNFERLLQEGCPRNLWIYDQKTLSRTAYLQDVFQKTLFRRDFSHGLWTLNPRLTLPAQIIK